MEGHACLDCAVQAARKHTQKTGKPTFVYQLREFDETRYDWCTEHEYRHTSHQWVREDKVLWSSVDGWY